jgi:N-acetylglucosamine kinase-like BadF-type ATPase
VFFLAIYINLLYDAISMATYGKDSAGVEMEDMRYFLGIDGGGTKTTAVVSDSAGRILCCCEGDSINYYAIGLEKARENMKKVISSIAEECGIGYFDGAFVGMSALNCRADEKELRAFTSGVIDAAKTDMDSDLYVALEALLEKGECAVAISGTGSMAIARDKKGEISCIGGWGHILGDEGSGYCIALDAIRAAIRAYEGSEPQTG